MYAEILKLEKMLNESGIAFCGGECSEGYVIFYPDIKSRFCCIVQSKDSTQLNKNLIEFIYLEEICQEYLTAEEVFNRIKKHWEEHKEELKR